MLFREILSRIVYTRVFSRLKACGKNVIFSKNGVIVRPEELEIGSNIFISRNFYISARSMRIGNNVMIGPNLVIECDDHIIDETGVSMYANRQNRVVSPISIEDDVWIGANVVILKGVTVREGSVIGAGSIVTKSTPPYCVAVGNPCKPTKTRFTIEQIAMHLASVHSTYKVETVINLWRQACLIVS